MTMTNSTSAAVFFVSSNPESLAALGCHATVEAEYGDACVPGSLLTMAHHGPRAGQPAPCSGRYEIPSGISLVGLSHLDLDSLGGCAAIIGRRPEAPAFWEAAEFVDINGPHALGRLAPSELVIRQLHAFWAWSEANRCFAPRDGSCADITAQVLAGVEIIERICALDETLLAAGDAHREAGERLNAESFIEERDGVILRRSSAFVNHLYTTPEGVVCRAVAALSDKFGSVTVSFADDASRGRQNAREIVQALWGDLAGGHDNIAGSPRGQAMNEADLRVCFDAIIASL